MKQLKNSNGLAFIVSKVAIQRGLFRHQTEIKNRVHFNYVRSERGKRALKYAITHFSGRPMGVILSYFYGTILIQHGLHPLPFKPLESQPWCSLTVLLDALGILLYGLLYGFSVLLYGLLYSLPKGNLINVTFCFYQFYSSCS